jgi:hypothetical protein
MNNVPIGNIENAIKTHSSPSQLKITDLRVATIRAPMRCPIIRLDTNQGIYGLGEVRDGASATYAAVDRIRTQVSGDIEKSLQEENAKEPETQNRLFVKTLSEKGQTLAAMWNEFTQKGWPTHQKTSDKLRGEFEALNQVFASLKDAEMAWHASGLDLGGLIGVLTAIDSRADAIKDQATAAVSNLKVALSVWETMAK